MRRAITALVLLLVVAAVAPAQDAPRPSPAPGQVRGRVVDSRTGAPVIAARVQVMRVGGAGMYAATTDSDGRFEMTGIPPGSYRMTSAKTGFAIGSFGQRGPQAPGRVFEVEPGQLFVGDIALVRGGVIAGRVVDEFGEPIAQLQVQAQRMRYSFDGERRPVVAGVGAVTDDLGQFRLYELMPGDYYVMASSATTNAPVPLAFAPEGGSEGYPPTFYPGTQNIAEAQLVPLAAGRDMFVQFTMTPARLARIQGTAVDASGRPAAGAVISLHAGSGSVIDAIRVGRGAAAATDGTFVINGVARGEYTVRARARAAGPLGLTNVSVGSSGDVRGVVVTMIPGATVTGRVVFEGASPRPRPMFNVDAQPAPVEGGQVLSLGRMAPSAADGSFEITDVHGRVHLFPVFTGDEARGWIAKAVLFNGDDVIDSGLDVTGRSAVRGVEIVVTDRVAAISGRVTDGNAPVTDYRVFLFRDSTVGPFPVRRMTQGQPGADGRFLITGLRRGTYHVAAFDAVDEDELYSPDLERRVRERGRTIVLDEGEQADVDLPLSGGL